MFKVRKLARKVYNLRDNFFDTASRFSNDVSSTICDIQNLKKNISDLSVELSQKLNFLIFNNSPKHQINRCQKDLAELRNLNITLEVILRKLG